MSEQAADTIRVFIIEDDPDWLRGLSAFLSRQPDIVITATASGREEALQLASSTQADVILMDIMLADSPDGIALTAELSRITEGRIVMLTSMQDKELILDAFQAGAVDYMVKSDYEGIPQAVRQAYRNKSPISAAAAEQMREEFRRLKRMEQEYKAKEFRSLLTPAETEILGLIRHGHTQLEIAGQLVVSLRTVKVHIGNILRKLGVKSSREAAEKAEAAGVFGEREDEQK